MHGTIDYCNSYVCGNLLQDTLFAVCLFITESRGEHVKLVLSCSMQYPKILIRQPCSVLFQFVCSLYLFSFQIRISRCFRASVSCCSILYNNSCATGRKYQWMFLVAGWHCLAGAYIAITKPEYILEISAIGQKLRPQHHSPPKLTFHKKGKVENIREHSNEKNER